MNPVRPSTDSKLISPVNADHPICSKHRRSLPSSYCGVFCTSATGVLLVVVKGHAQWIQWNPYLDLKDLGISVFSIIANCSWGAVCADYLSCVSLLLVVFSVEIIFGVQYNDDMCFSGETAECFGGISIDGHHFRHIITFLANYWSCYITSCLVYAHYVVCPYICTVPLLK